jgi:hypothetical protein
MKRMLIATAAGAAALAGAVIASAAPPAGDNTTLSAKKAPAPAAAQGFDAVIARHSETMLEQGRKIFRYDTFGSEAFWGDALQLHKAIAGAKNGGVGPGVSPKTALAVGLKVDSDALPASLIKQIKAGKVNLCLLYNLRAHET